jgi:hypothetical protein
MGKVYWKGQILSKCHWISNTKPKDKYDFEEKLKDLKDCIARYDEAKERVNRVKNIIHKFEEKNGKYFYLCNQAVRAIWTKTDMANHKVNCQNCLKIMKGDKSGSTGTKPIIL